MHGQTFTCVCVWGDSGIGGAFHDRLKVCLNGGAPWRAGVKVVKVEQRKRSGAVIVRHDVFMPSAREVGLVFDHITITRDTAVRWHWYARLHIPYDERGRRKLKAPEPRVRSLSVAAFEPGDVEYQRARGKGVFFDSLEIRRC